MGRRAEFSPYTKRCNWATHFGLVSRTSQLRQLSKIILADYDTILPRHAHLRGIFNGATDIEDTWGSVSNFGLLNSSVTFEAVSHIDQSFFHRCTLRLKTAPRASGRAEVACCNFYACWFRETSYFRYTRFSNCRLIDVDLGPAQLNHVWFVNCDLSGSDFTNTSGGPVYLVNCKYEGTSGLGLMKPLPDISRDIGVKDILYVKWLPVTR